MLATQNDGLYTVIDGQIGIIAHKVPRQDAVDAIYAVFDDEPPFIEVVAILDGVPNPGAWRSEFAAATAVELQQHDDRLGNTPTAQEVAELRKELEAITHEQQAIIGEVQLDSKSRDLDQIKIELVEEHARLIQALADDMDADFDDIFQEFSKAAWRQIEKTQLWQEYERLVTA